MTPLSAQAPAEHVRARNPVRNVVPGFPTAWRRSELAKRFSSDFGDPGEALERIARQAFWALSPSKNSAAHC